MSKKLQCQDCGRAEYGEDLYNYDGKILCRYCIVSRVCEGLMPCEYVGTCNDKTFPNKNEQIYQLKQQLAEKDKEIESLKQHLEETNAGYDFIYEQSRETIKELKQNQKQLAIQELEKVKELLLIESKNNPIVYDVNDDTVGGALDRDKTFEVIDQQIKELKGEKEVED